MHDVRTKVLNHEIVTTDNSVRHVVSLAGGLASDGVTPYLLAADGTQFKPEKYVTFEPEIGTKAYNLQGQEVDARVEIKLTPKKRGDGFWTNYVLEDIGPVGSLIPMAMPAPGGTPAQPQPPTTAAQPLSQVTPTPHPLLAAEETQKSEERRRSAMHAALDFVATKYEGSYADALRVAQQLTDDLVHYVGAGTWQNDQNVAATPQAIAEAANAEAGAPVVAAGVQPPFQA